MSKKDHNHFFVYQKEASEDAGKGVHISLCRGCGEIKVTREQVFPAIPFKPLPSPSVPPPFVPDRRLDRWPDWIDEPLWRHRLID